MPIRTYTATPSTTSKYPVAASVEPWFDPRETISAVIKLIRDLLGVQAVVVSRIENGEWCATHCLDGVFGLEPGTTFPADDGYCHLVAKSRRPLTISDAASSPDYFRYKVPAELGVRTYIGVPIVRRDGSVYGTLCGVDRSPSFFGKREVETLQVLARLVADELDREDGLRTIRAEDEERFQAMVQHSSDLISIYDRDGVLRYASPAFSSLLGHDSSDWIGRSALTLIHPDDMFRVQLTFARLNANPAEQRHVTFRARHADGTWRWLEAAASNLLDVPAVAGIVANARDITERVEAETRYHSLIDHVPAIVSLNACDEQCSTLYISPQIERMCGYTPEECVADPTLWLRRIHPDDRERVLAAIKLAYESRDSLVLEYRAIHKDGRVLWFRDESMILRDADDVPVRWQTFQTDITTRREMETALQESEARFRVAFAHAPIGLALVSLEGRFLHANAALLAMTGFTERELLDRSIQDVAHPDGVSTFVEFWRGALSGPGGPSQFEQRLVDKEGRLVDALLGISLVHDEHGGAVHFVVQIQDMTERKAMEAQLAHQAFHDPLTKLPNRALFVDRLDHALRTSHRRGESVAVLYLDLDRFKHVNDGLGHAAGDQLLARVGERLTTCLRDADTIARLGGDEFAILLEAANVATARRVAERVHAALMEPFAIEGRELYVGASIGLAMSTTDRSTADELIRVADVALYRAKRAGRGIAVVFDPRETDPLAGWLALEAELRRAIERNEFTLHYQPVISFDTGRVVAAEALVRWNHAERGLLLPAEFLPIAEETGLIAPISAWVLREACHQLACWQEELGPAAPLQINVNVTTRDLRDPALAERILSTIRDEGLDPSRLRIEVTEHVLIEELRAAAGTLRTLRDCGVGLAIDDFGAGASSLSSLRSVDVEVLKLDRSFTDGLVDGGEDRVIVEAITSMARALGLLVTAEGIETAEQLHAARAAGCDRGQGYFFTHPLTASALAQWLRDWHTELPDRGFGRGRLVRRSRIAPAIPSRHSQSSPVTSRFRPVPARFKHPKIAGA